MKPSVTVVIPALNEEKLLESVVQDTLAAIGDRFDSYEVIIINDGSTDQTGKIADRVTRGNLNVRAIHHAQNMGLGSSVREGYDLATKDYVIWNPGDHGMLGESLSLIFDQTGKADIVIPYIANPAFRSFRRRFISQAYVGLLNKLFGLKLRYYNGPVMYRTDLVQAAKTATLGFAFFAEMLILLVKAGNSYVEIPTYHQRRAHGSSKAFRFKNLIEILSMVLRLLWSTHFKGAKQIVVSSKIAAN